MSGELKICRIRLHGEEYWLPDGPNERGPISPLDHFSPDGELLCSPLADSFAHYIPGKGIMRYGRKIAECSEIEIIDGPIDIEATEEK